MPPKKKPVLPVTGDPEADQLLVDDPLARLLGMLLDQQVPMEWAFGSPRVLRQRLGGTLDAARIATMPIEELEAMFKGPPALHRYPGSMAKRTQQLCQHLVDEYGGRADALWSGAATGPELFARLKALPGFGVEKAKIFLALLAKRFDVAPPGWEEAALPFSDELKRSVADIDSAQALAEVRAFKQRKKLDGKLDPDAPLPKPKAPRVPKGLLTSDTKDDSAT
ncbi:MAG: Fe-S cluster assembly protein HesB [Actinomycetota bacterium]|nr:Fe-S cluster assembly protein HesB [Actinomycetota bacterium]